MPAPPPHPDQPSEIEEPDLIIEGRINVLLVVDKGGTRDAIVVMPSDQVIDVVSLVGALERAKFLIQAQWKREE